jgi:putative PIN family toxin of toxin-antitoxin system
MVDSNVVISAMLFPESVPARALFDIMERFDLVLCDYVVDEIYDVVRRKFPERIDCIDTLFSKLIYSAVNTVHKSNDLISDPKDAPILNTAIDENMDYLVSGDRHFLSLNIKKPKILSPSDYLKNTT